MSRISEVRRGSPSGWLLVELLCPLFASYCTVLRKNSEKRSLSNSSCFRLGVPRAHRRPAPALDSWPSPNPNIVALGLTAGPGDRDYPTCGSRAGHISFDTNIWPRPAGLCHRPRGHRRVLELLAQPRRPRRHDQRLRGAGTWQWRLSTPPGIRLLRH